MKNLEDILSELDIPVISDDPYQPELRRKLVQRYFPSTSAYKIRFRFAMSLLLVFALFIGIMIINPGFNQRIHHLFFREKAAVIPNYLTELNEPDPELDRLLQEELARMKYTSIYNPLLEGKVDPADYQEDKTYLIRKYTSSTQESIMIISEFPQEKPRTHRKISY